MRGVITLCCVISWAAICGTILAKNEMDASSVENQGDLEELYRLLEKEEFLKTKIKGIDYILRGIQHADEGIKKVCDDGKTKCPFPSTRCKLDEQEKKYICECTDGYKLEMDPASEYIGQCREILLECGDGKTSCPSHSTNCTKPDDSEECYCACKENFRLPDGSTDVGNKGSCEEYIACPDDQLKCDKGTTKCEDNKCICENGFKPLVDDDGVTNKERCTPIPYVCKEDDCKFPNTKCKANGAGFYCDCNEGYQPKSGVAQEENKGECEAIPVVDYVCKEDDCKFPNTKCKAKGADFYCDCDKGYRPKNRVPQEENKGECVAKTKCDDPKVTCDAATTDGCVPKTGNDYYCKCKNEYKPKSGKVEDNKGACIKKTKCDDGTYNCDKETTECVIDGEGYYCKCLPNYVLKEGVKMKENKQECTSGCDKNLCKNFIRCDPKGKDYKCICKTFFSGKDCTEAYCDKNTCKNGGQCKRETKSDNTKTASCECKDPFTGPICETNSWCDHNYCGTSDQAECKYTEEHGGYCKCKNEKQRFNYANLKCEDPPKCLDIKCDKPNTVCNPDSGECECKKGYVNETTTNECKSVRCEETCFEGSTCSEVDGVRIKCSCNDTHYYIINKCEDASCLLSNQRKECKQDCPSGMERREDGQCKPVKKDGDKTTVQSCGKNCGKFGYCNLEENGEGKMEEICECIDEAEKNEKGECVLKQSVCPDGVELAEDKLKCKCTGKFKQSKNGITCERKSCSDKDVQEECQKMKAVCHDDWLEKNGYDCRCKVGYVHDKDNNNICIDKTSDLKNKATCAEMGKIAFLDENGESRCFCPPGLYAAGQNLKCTAKYTEKSTYLVQNLPISNVKYIQNSALDVVSLTKDVILAMKQTFVNLEFAVLYKYNLKGDAIYCSVWLQFKGSSEFDYKRIPVAAFENGLLMPDLHLIKAEKNNVQGKKMELCSGLDNDPICGGTECENEKCKCRPGFKVLDASVRVYSIDSNEIRIFKCEDINECEVGSDNCPKDTTACINIEGSFYCRCLPKYKLKKDKTEAQNQEACIGACNDPNPCNSGKCSINEKTSQVDCSCPLGYAGSYCDKKDVALAGAHKKTVIVGAVLGTILGVLIIAIIAYVIRQKKYSHSEDFSPVPRMMDNAEMTERRPMRGVTNRAYQ